MSKEKRRVPKLRFPGFTEDWEQRKLSDILKVNSGKDYKHLDQGNIPVYGTGGYMLSVNKSLSNIDAIGIGRKGTIDKPQYLKAPFWTVDTLFYLTALGKHSILFLYYLMQLIPWKKFDESTGVPSLSKTTIDSISAYVPSNFKEEELISSLFNQLDISITLHQRKLDNLKLKKKALLQKLFPKNGERYPELRFPGFTDAWEQREFSDIFAEVKSGLSRMLSNDDIGLPVVRANNINDGQLNLVDDIKYWYKNDPQGANTNNYLIEQGDILINFINSEAKMGTAAYVTRRPERDTIYTTNILRCKVNDEYNPYFIYSLTFLNSYKNYIASITKPAVNQASFTTVDFKKYSIKIPTVKEQNQIADLIKTFNKLITLHQRKLDHLQLQKKALLQQMFV